MHPDAQRLDPHIFGFNLAAIRRPDDETGSAETEFGDAASRKRRI